ncbi:MAG: isoprenylcysteine carboxylmethyltransferase family protein [Nitrospirae bacterium]|nr:isoprenylcysteine carboxylmethyltransferase family protein [Nitrospirota bacterium]
MDSADHAGVRIPPPLYALSGIVAGIAAQRWLPLTIGTAERAAPLRIAGGVLIALGLGMILHTAVLFRRARTDIKPWKPSSTLIRVGLMKFSRNPIYLAFLVIQTGTALAARTYWIALLIVPVFLALRYFVVAREERYLERAFGEAYLDYKSRVRRWL